MNSKNILIWLFLLVPVMVYSQNDTSDNTTATADSSFQELQADAGMGQTIFYNESERRNKRGCSFIQNPWKDREMKVTKNGYTLITQDEDEVVKVKNIKSGGSKVNYSNDFETLKYKTDKSGKATYKYTYFNECKKVKLKKNKNGITSVKNKSGLETSDVRNSAYQAINRGVRTCQNMGN